MKKLIFFLACVCLAQTSNPPYGAGGGPTIAATLNILAGDNSGNAVSAGFLAAAVALLASPTFTGIPAAPTAAIGNATTQIATDAYVAAATASINPAVSVQAGTIAVLSNTPTYANGSGGVGATLTAGSNGALTIDSYVVLLNDRVLVKNQVSTFQNGVYTLTTLGDGSTAYVLTRATDYNTTTNINYTGTIPVLQGTTNANTGWNLTTQIALVGTDALSYTQAAAGNSGGPPGGNVKASGNLANGNAIQGAGGKTIVDTGVAFANLVQAAAAASAAKKVCTASGATKTCTYIDLPQVFEIPAANCVSTVAGAGWSTTLTPTCWAGTNNLGGYLPFVDTSVAQFSFQIPGDWDTAAQPYIKVVFGSGANTTGTVIFNAATACSKEDGSVTSDPTFTTADALATKTMAAASRFWSTTIQMTQVTSGNSCLPGGLMIVKITRATDTASTAVFVDKTVITVPRLITVQAN